MDPVLTWTFLGVGVFGQGVALLLARRPLKLVRAGGRAEGTVIGNVDQVVTSSKGPSRTYFFPQISFVTKEAVTVVFQSMSGGPNPRPTGARTRVIYDPGEPANAMEQAFGTMWLFPLLTSVFSLPFLVAGIWGLVS
jgi:hypothetical protein